MTRRERFSLAVREQAQELFNLEPTPTAAEMARRLADEFDSSGDPVPSERAIRDWIKTQRIVKADTDRQWTFMDGSPEDAKLVLEVLDAETNHLYSLLGRPRTLNAGTTLGRARYIARIRRVAPDCDDLVMVYAMARHAAQGHERDVHNVLSQRPWTLGGRKMLMRLLREGRAPKLWADIAAISEWEYSE